MHQRSARSADPELFTRFRATCRTILLLCAIAACLCPMVAFAQNQGAPVGGSVEQLKALAEKGNAEAQLKLAELYRTG